MSLIRLHRILILTFIAFLLFFAWLMWTDASNGRTGQVTAIVSVLLAIAGAVYLLRAKHLRTPDDREGKEP